MSKKSIFLCCLFLAVAVLSNVVWAAAPYASIVVYNQNIGNNNSDGKPNISTLGTLDIINMTPWNISIGNGPLGTPILPGMTATTLTSFWMQGINTAYVTDSSSINPAFAFHSIQIPLTDLNGVWPLDTNLHKGNGSTCGDPFGGPTNLSTIPIVFNTNNFTQSGNTVALNFSVLSTAGFTKYTNSDSQGVGDACYYYPATALSIGDGTNNYGWRSNDTLVDQKSDGVNKTNTTQFLTIQALQGGNTWKPITNNLAGSASNKGADGSKPGTLVQSPEYVTASGLAYPNFSSMAGISAIPGQNYDLVVILQAGGYVDSALLFLAVPSSNNALLSGAK